MQLENLQSFNGDNYILFNSNLTKIKDIYTNREISDTKRTRNKESIYICTKEGYIIIGRFSYIPSINNNNGLFKYYRRADTLRYGDYLIRPIINDKLPVIEKERSCDWALLNGIEGSMKSQIYPILYNEISKDKWLFETRFGDINYEINEIIRSIKNTSIKNKILFLRGVYLFNRSIKGEPNLHIVKGMKFLEGKKDLIEFISYLLVLLDIRFYIDIIGESRRLYIERDSIYKFLKTINEEEISIDLSTNNEETIPTYLVRKILGKEYQEVLSGVYQYYVKRQELVKRLDVLHSKDKGYEFFLDLFSSYRLSKIKDIRPFYSSNYNLYLNPEFYIEEIKKRNRYLNYKGFINMNGYLTLCSGLKVKSKYKYIDNK